MLPVGQGDLALGRLQLRTEGVEPVSDGMLQVQIHQQRLIGFALSALMLKSLKRQPRV